MEDHPRGLSRHPRVSRGPPAVEGPRPHRLPAAPVALLVSARTTEPCSPRRSCTAAPHRPSRRACLGSSWLSLCRKEQDMDVGMGVPNALLDVEGPELVAWARRAEQRGFSVLGTIGRIAYGSHEELIALAGAAGATERIELMTTVLVAPPRQAVLLAKQAATLQAVSGGRLRLGLGIGGGGDERVPPGGGAEEKGQKIEGGGAPP